MNTLLELDKELFIFFNGLHTPWLDTVMYYLSEKYIWIPLYAGLLYLSYKKYGTKSWLVVVGIAITIILADRITSGVMKPFFERLRPSHEPSLSTIVHIVKDRGGDYGFASSHAANTFAIAMFFWLILHDRFKHIQWLFLWAALVTYSRIYLGLHYPGDIVVGGLIGIVSAWAGFYLMMFLVKKVNDQKTGNSLQ